MSANYHAFQNKGVLFSVHEALAEQWQTEFTHYAPNLKDWHKWRPE